MIPGRQPQDAAARGGSAGRDAEQLVTRPGGVTPDPGASSATCAPGGRRLLHGRAGQGRGRAGMRLRPAAWSPRNATPRCGAPTRATRRPGGSTRSGRPRPQPIRRGRCGPDLFRDPRQGTAQSPDAGDWHPARGVARHPVPAGSVHLHVGGVHVHHHQPQAPHDDPGAASGQLARPARRLAVSIPANGAGSKSPGRPRGGRGRQHRHRRQLRRDDIRAVSVQRSARQRPAGGPAPSPSRS